MNGTNYSAPPSATTPIAYIPPRPESEDVLARAARDLELLRSLTSASKALFDTDKQINVQLLELHRPQIEKALNSITTDVPSSGLPPLPPGKSKRSHVLMENKISSESPLMSNGTTTKNDTDHHSIRSASPNSINVASALSLLGVHNQQTHNHLIDTTSEEDYDNSSDSSDKDKCSEIDSIDNHLSKKRTLSDEDWVIEQEQKLQKVDQEMN